MENHFKLKVVVTIGIFYFVWRHRIARRLRDDFGAVVDPGQQVWASFIPIYGAIIWWRFLKIVRSTAGAAGLAEPLVSPGRAFWVSSIWFGAGPYVNKRLNALYTFRAGLDLASAAPIAVPAI